MTESRSCECFTPRATTGVSSKRKAGISHLEEPASGDASENQPGAIHCSPTHPRRQRPRGRPSTFSDDLADAIAAAIAEFGHTDTGAGAKLGVAASTLSRWKKENEGFATDLEAARAEFKERILAEIRNAKKRDGSPEWRAYAWILERGRRAPSRGPLPPGKPELPSQGRSKAGALERGEL